MIVVAIGTVRVAVVVMSPMRVMSVWVKMSRVTIVLVSVLVLVRVVMN